MSSARKDVPGAANGADRPQTSTATPSAIQAQHGPHFRSRELTTRAWREEALARATEMETLSNWIDKLPPDRRGEPEQDADRHLADAIRDHIAAVRTAAMAGGPWMRTGARLGRVASNLNAAEANLLRRAPLDYLFGELPSLEARVRRHLPVDDPRRVRVDDLAHGLRDGAGELTQRDRESLIAATRAASSAGEREQQRIRNFRTILAAATVLLFVIASIVGLLGALRPAMVALCFEPQQTRVIVCPTGQSVVPEPNGTDQDVDDAVRGTVSAWDVPLVEILGLVTAGVTGAVALRHLRGSSTPFGVPVALTVLKLPTGALTAFLGLLLMRGGFVPGLTALDSTPQILAWAVIFGASQQLFTGLVDRQAQNVFDSVGGKTYTPTGGS
jgi:hypothetical protein